MVRERLTAGDSEPEVIDYVVSRYGDFVLLKPPFKLSTYALWLGPGVIAIVAILALVAFYRRRSRTAGRDAAAPLSESESKTLAALLGDDRR